MRPQRNLAVPMDVLMSSRREWHLGHGLDQSPTLQAFRQALAHVQSEIHHSDQGVQYVATAHAACL